MKLAMGIKKINNTDTIFKKVTVTVLSTIGWF